LRESSQIFLGEGCFLGVLSDIIKNHMATLIILINLILSMFSGSSASVSRNMNGAVLSGTSATSGKFQTVTIQNGRTNPIIVTTDWD